MTSALEQQEVRRYRAPREDRSVLMEPSLDGVGECLAANRRLEDRFRYDCQGRALGDLFRQARRELLREAAAWTASYRDAPEPPHDGQGEIAIAGHQPQLFHPGVWLKNFVLGWIAGNRSAVAVNLLVDNDAVRGTSIRVPSGAAPRPFWTEMALDRPGASVPYEERPVQDLEWFAGFADRATRRLAPLVSDPLLDRYWPMAVDRTRATGLLGAGLAQARHRLEGQWGVATLEVPLSRVCAGEPFAWFAAHLLAHLPRFREIYNEVVGEYRRAHGIRNAAHPVPDLTSDRPWLEAPFWVWSKTEPRRRALFALHRDDRIELTDRTGWRISLPLGPESEANGAVERLLDMALEGVKLRPRALITTLWARLALGDLFVHGIGGAKYDQVTDRLVQRFFGLAAPHLMVVSGTLLLPVERPGATEGELRAVRHGLRELTWHPERHLDGDLAAPSSACACLTPASLAAQKARWIAAPVTSENARTRFLEIRRINEALQPFVAPQREALAAREAEIERRLRAERVLGWREYAFCLYPQRELLDFFDGLLPKSA